MGSICVLGGDRRPCLRRFLHVDPVARHRPVVPEARDEARRDDEHQRRGCPCDPHRGQLGRDAARQTMGPDSGRLVHIVGSDRQSAEQPEVAGQSARVRRARRIPAFPRLAQHVHGRQPEHPARVRRHGSRAGARARIRHCRPWHRHHGIRRPARESDERARAGPDEHPHQGDDRPAGEGVFRPGPWRARHARQRSSRVRERRRRPEAR